MEMEPKPLPKPKGKPVLIDPASVLDQPEIKPAPLLPKKGGKPVEIKSKP